MAINHTDIPSSCQSLVLGVVEAERLLTEGSLENSVSKLFI